MIRLFSICFLIFITSGASAATLNEKVYILSDSLTTVDNVKFSYITFNESNSFTQNNPIIELNEDDSLSLWVVNFDTISHDFIIGSYTSTSTSIPAGDSVHVGFTFNSSGVYIYHDPTNYPTYQYLGLAGLVVVKNHNHSSFLLEHKRA